MCVVFNPLKDYTEEDGSGMNNSSVTIQYIYIFESVRTFPKLRGIT